jgi:hypothetical protein
MKNKTQRRIHKYFFLIIFCFVFFRKNNIRGNAATNNTPNEGKKNHRGKVEEVERLQYLFEFPLGTNVLPKSRILCQC